MTYDVLKPGDVVLAALPLNDPKGHEQEGKRPVIVVGIPQGTLRYPVVIVVPLTTQSGPWAEENPSLYQHLPAGSGGLPQTSIALLDQIRALDVQRVNAYLGSLEPKIFSPICSSLLQLFERA
jgi:mRNA interferase MazF